MKHVKAIFFSKVTIVVQNFSKISEQAISELQTVCVDKTELERQLFCTKNSLVEQSEKSNRLSILVFLSFDRSAT